MVAEKLSQHIVLGLVMGISLIVPMKAYSAEPLDENSTQTCGGIGSDEEDAIKSGQSGNLKINYNLMITNSDGHGHYVTNINIEVSRKNKPPGSGATGFGGNDCGPLLYAKVPAGIYTIDATNGQEHYTKDVTVSEKKPTTVNLFWKED
jgi:hypothetical protein